MTKLVLASASPRRRQLLAQIGVTPDAISPADIDETPNADERPRAYVLRMALEKGHAVHVSGQFTLAGDTVVAVGRRILPKAERPEDVEMCLNLLSGRAHTVLTAICVLSPAGHVAHRVSQTRVQVKRMTPKEIADYVASKDGLGKAGGYAIQGPFGRYIKHIRGSYTGVMGLPVFETAQLLSGLGYRL
ncbi:MAG: nucleoside triphosphate pyrophosphatase [Pseudomonadota bacterium]